MSLQVGLVPAHSDPITLSPGVKISGQTVTEAVVRLLTRRDHASAQRETDDNARDDLLLSSSIVSLGDVTDKAIISEAIQYLAIPDVVRLRSALADLEARHLIANTEPGEAMSALTVPVSEMRSETFSLDPGILIDGKQVTNCAVRLLTRAQWREIHKAPENEREDLALFHAVAQLGDNDNVTREQVDLLTDVDVTRIEQEVEALRAQHAPEPKSQCPNCGTRW